MATKTCEPSGEICWENFLAYFNNLLVIADMGRYYEISIALDNMRLWCRFDTTIKENNYAL